MAYYMYIGDMPLPVTPSKIDTKIKGRNKTLNLINDQDINVLKAPGLTEISFDALLPNVKHPFRNKELGFDRANAKFYLDEFERLKLEKKPFYFKIIRTFPDGRTLYNTNMKVSLEDYSIKEDVKQGFDVVVTVKLKQYVDYSTKIIKVESDGATVQTERSTDNAPNVKTYTVVEGDSLWNIAKRFYGNGAKYLNIYYANQSIIGNNPSLIYAGQVLTIPDATQDVPVVKTSTKKNTISASTSTDTSSEEVVSQQITTPGVQKHTSTNVKQNPYYKIKIIGLPGHRNVQIYDIHTPSKIGYGMKGSEDTINIPVAGGSFLIEAGLAKDSIIKDGDYTVTIEVSPPESAPFSSVPSAKPGVSYAFVCSAVNDADITIKYNLAIESKVEWLTK